jgi:hypothetical protein
MYKVYGLIRNIKRIGGEMREENYENKKIELRKEMEER